MGGENSRETDRSRHNETKRNESQEEIIRERDGNSVEGDRRKAEKSEMKKDDKEKRKERDKKEERKSRNDEKVPSEEHGNKRERDGKSRDKGHSRSKENREEKQTKESINPGKSEKTRFI